MPSTANLQNRGFVHLFFLFIISALILSGVFYVLFYGKKDIARKQSYSGPIEKVIVGNVGEYTIFNLIAQEKGIFANNGLDVELKEYTSGPASIAALLAEEVNVTIAADFVGVRNIFADPDIRILAQVNQHKVFSIAGRKDMGLQTPKDLIGKRIGITKNSAGEFFIGSFLTFNNLQFSDVTLVDLTPPEMISQLTEGTIDAVVVFEPNIFKLKKQFGENLSAWDVQGDQNISALVYTKDAYLNEHPALVERYIQSLVDAEEYYHNNIQETKDIVAQKLKYETDYIEYSWPKFNHTVTLNQELILNMEREAQWVISNGLTDQKRVPNYLDFISFNALEKAKPDSITIIK